MSHDVSFGIVPVRKTQHGWETLLVYQSNGFWGFPKGHPDKGETPKETAARELFEETGYTVVRYLSDEKFQESYFFVYEGKKIHKTVTFYVAEVEGEPCEPNDEVLETRWISLEKADTVLTYPQAKSIALNVYNLLK